jgi:hypothetical protein
MRDRRIAKGDYQGPGMDLVRFNELSMTKKVENKNKEDGGLYPVHRHCFIIISIR